MFQPPVLDGEELKDLLGGFAAVCPGDAGQTRRAAGRSGGWRAGHGNLNSSISVETAPEGEDLSYEDWSKDEQKTPPHALSGFQSQGGVSCHSRRQDAGRIDEAACRTPQPNHRLKELVAEPGGRRIRRRVLLGRAGGEFEWTACQDRPAGTGDRFFVRRAQQGRPAERKAMI